MKIKPYRFNLIKMIDPQTLIKMLLLFKRITWIYIKSSGFLIASLLYTKLKSQKSKLILSKKTPGS